LSLCVFGSCDLFNDMPRSGLREELEEAIWLANQPRVDVRMELMFQGSGVTNPPLGIVSPRPAVEIPLKILFSIRAGYGFVEWRAYWQDETRRDLDHALGPELVSFKDKANPETEVTIKTGGRAVSIVPFAPERPVLVNTFPPKGGTEDRLPTNQPFEFWFDKPVQNESVNLSTIKIGGTSRLGTGEYTEDLSHFFLAPQGDEGGLYFRLETKEGGVPQNYNISITVGPDIFLRDYPGVGMEKAEQINYGAGETADRTAPVVEALRASANGTDFLNETFDAGNTAFVLENGEILFYLSAYKVNGNIRNVRITETKPGTDLNNEGNLSFRSYPYEQEESDAPLAAQFYSAYKSYPAVIRHEVLTPEDGIILFYIQPEDNLGNRLSLAGAGERGCFVRAVADRPPSAPASVQGAYYRDSGTLELGWAVPGETDFARMEIEYQSAAAWEADQTPVPAQVLKAQGNHFTVSGIPGDDKIYRFRLRAVDERGHRSPWMDLNIRANLSTPVPVRNLAGAYNKTEEALDISWENPSDPVFAEVHLYWSKAGGAENLKTLQGQSAGASGNYRLLNISEDGSLYTIRAAAADGQGMESPLESILVYADATPPSPVTGARVSYDAVSLSFAVNWQPPLEEDLEAVLVSLNGTVLGEAVAAGGNYVINGIPKDQQTYTITLRSKDRAGNVSSPVSLAALADGQAPASAGNFTAVYDAAGAFIDTGWDDPSDEDLRELRLAWTRAGTASGSAVIQKGRETYRISGVPGDPAEYAFMLRSIDMAGNISVPASITIDVDGIPPASVGDLRGVYDRQAGTISINWNNPPDADFDSLSLEWGPIGDSKTTLSLSKNVTSYTAAIPDGDTLYSFSIRALDTAGNRSASAVVRIRAALVPPPPGNISAGNTLDSGELQVSWDAEPSAQSYELWLNSSNDVTTASAAAGIAGTSVTLEGLENGFPYYIWVRSVNTAGKGNFSSPAVSAMPLNNVTSLGNITVNGQAIGGFTPDSGTCAAVVPYGAAQVTVAALPLPGSNVTVSYTPSQPMSLEQGDTKTVTITVTAQNGVSFRKYTVEVLRKKRFTVEILGPEDENIGISYEEGDLSYSAGDSAEFLVSGDYSSVAWYVDGVKKGTGQSFTVNAASYIPRTYTLTAAVVKNGLLYTKDISFKVVH
jgi:hypothetical protein